MVNVHHATKLGKKKKGTVCSHLPSQWVEMEEEVAFPSTRKHTKGPNSNP